MNGRTLALFLTVVTVIGLLVLFLRHGGEPTGGGVQQVVEATDLESSSRDQDVLKVGEQIDGTTLIDEREALSAEVSLDPTGPESVVSVFVLAEVSREPIEGAYVLLTANARAKPVEDRAFGVAGEKLRSDAEGSVTFTVPPDRPLRGRVTASEAGFEPSVIEVDPLRSGEQRRLEVVLTRETRSFDYFLVLDRETGEPVRGAQLIKPIASQRSRFGQQTDWPGAKRWELSDPVLAESDGDGHFRLTHLSAHPVRFELHAAGYGPAWVRTQGEHPSPDDPLRIHVSRSASLTGLIQTKGAGEGASLSIGLLAPRFAMLAWETPAGHIPSGDMLWSTKIAPSGAYSLENIPAHTNLQLEIRVAGEVLYHHATKLKLESGEERVFDWAEGAGSAVFGELIDPRESPAGRHLWLVGATRRAQVRLLSRFDRPAYETRTDEMGHFRFEDVTAGAYWLGERPGARGNQGSFAIPVDVPSLGSNDLELPSLVTIAGQVVFEGEGVEGILISAWREDVQGNSPQTESDAEGNFELSLAVEGPWRLSASDYNSSAGALVGSENPLVSTGTLNARLELVRAVRFAGTIEDETGRAISARVMLMARSPGADSLGAFGYRTSFDFSGLTPGRYALYAYSVDGLAETSADVELRAGEELAGFVLRLKPAVLVHVENTGESTRFFATLSRAGVVLVSLQLFDDKTGTFSILPGSYQLEVRTRPDTKPIVVREVTFVAGEEARLEFNADG